MDRGTCTQVKHRKKAKKFLYEILNATSVIAQADIYM